MGFHKRLIPIYLLSLINILGFTLLIPVFPSLVEEYGGNAVTYGMLISIYSLAQLIATPIMGTLSDKYGRRPMLLISQLGTLIGWIIFSLAFFAPKIGFLLLSVPMWLMLVSRMIDGLTGGNVSIATAYLSDLTTEEERLKAFSVIGIISSLGLVLGPVLGGVAASSRFGNHGPVLLAIIISGLTLASIYWGLKESLPDEHRRRKLELSWAKELNIFYKILKFRSEKRLAYLIDQRITIAVVMSAYVSILILFIRQIFSWTPWQLGLMFLVVGGYFAVCQGFLLGWLSKHYGQIRTLRASYISLFVGLILMPFAKDLLTFALPMILTATGIALSLPLIKTLLTVNVDKSQQGEITGVDEAINAGSSAVMPLLGGLLFSYSIHAFWVSCAIISGIGIGISFANRKNYS